MPKSHRVIVTKEDAELGCLSSQVPGLFLGSPLMVVRSVCKCSLRKKEEWMGDSPTPPTSEAMWSSRNGEGALQSCPKLDKGLRLTAARREM